MKDNARLVIIGGGIVGCSAAYHLAKLGWRDMVVVEQGPLFETGGSTSHAPGLVFQTNFAKMMCNLSQYTVKLYSELDLDGLPCWYPVGSLEFATTRARWEDLKRKQGAATSWGLEAHLISPAETKNLVPILDEGKIQGSYYVPSDGLAKAVRAAEAMAREAARGGAAEFHTWTEVTGIETKNGRVQAVITDQGRIECEMVLCCAGIWGPKVGRMGGVTIPLIPVQHLYARTTGVPELAGETREIVHPVIRHQDMVMYFRQHADCYGIGTYKHEPMLVEPDEIRPHREGALPPASLAFTPEHFQVGHTAAVELFPSLKGLGLTHQFNGMFSFTPDGYPVIGESMEVRGFWAAEAIWVTHGGGAGKVVAEWMAEGEPSIDLREADLNRFHPHALTRSYIRSRGTQQYREVYDIIHPMQQMEHPRGLRISPFHRRLEEQGAVFFESVGWERPQWCDANAHLVEEYEVPGRTGWAAQYWSPIQGAEHRATRERAALFDLTAFTKIEVSGTGALGFLQRLSANQMDQPVGKVAYTSMLTPKGGIMCDLTVTRLRPDRFWVLTGGGMGMHDLAWLRRNAPEDGSVRLSDVTSRFCAVGLWGPRARDVLSAVCDEDLGNQAFPYYTARRVSVDTVPALALRVSYAGELGWEIYTPTEYGLNLWDTLWEAGKPHGIIAAGGGAFDSLRLEKGYRFWGADMHTEYNPYEAGLGWAVKLDKGDFIGREALRRVKEQGMTRKLCCLTLDEAGAVLLGKEPIFDGAGGLGYATSTNYGYSVGKHIAYGYLPVEYAVEGTKVEIGYFGRRHKATVVKEPLYDPEGRRLRA